MTFDLQFGAVDLVAPKNTTVGYWCQALGDDLDLGAPAAVEQEITSFLQDGSIATIESWDNRTLTIPVAVCGTTAANLAAAELALVNEVGDRNVLTYTPSGNGAPCVFDVVNSKLAPGYDDVLELNALQRIYTLTIVALPFARTGSTTTVSWAAPPAGTPTVTVVDACTSTTGWAGSPNAATTSGGSVFENWSAGGTTQTKTVSLTRSGLSASMTTTPFVRLDFSVGGGSGTSSITTTVKINGTAVTATNTSGSVSWFAMPGGATTLTSVAVSAGGTTASFLGIGVADISRSSASADTAGQRQTSRSVAIAGSARTQGAVTLTDATPAALGTVLVYTCPTNVAVAQPPLRTFLTSGNTQTTDTSLISGKSSDLSSLHTFDVPASQVPDGTYSLVARLKHATGATYTVTYGAKSRLGSTNLDANPQTGTKSVALTAATWKVAQIANLNLPTANMGSAGLVRIELSGVSGLLVDEAWLFNLDTGRLSLVECGTGTPASGGPASVLFLTPASLSSPVPQIQIGTASDGSDAYDPGAMESTGSFGDHEFLPGQMSVWTASSNSIAMAGSVTYSPRYMTHVA